MSPLLALVLAAQVTVAVAPAQKVTAALTLDRITIELASRDRLRVELQAAPLDPAHMAPVRTQRLLLANVPVPVVGAPSPRYLADKTVISFEVDLRNVPENVLGIPFDRVPVRWEGRDEGESLVLAVMGEIDPNDRGRLVAPVEEIAKTYARLDDTSIAPGLIEVTFRGLVRLYNPFSFDVVVTRFDYVVKVGEDRIMSGLRPGFRLRPGVSSDVLLEQSAATADVAAAAIGAVVGGKPISVDGTIVLRAPTGEQAVPIRLAGTI